MFLDNASYTISRFHIRYTGGGIITARSGLSQVLSWAFGSSGVRDCCGSFLQLSDVSAQDGEQVDTLEDLGAGASGVCSGVCIGVDAAGVARTGAVFSRGGCGRSLAVRGSVGAAGLLGYPHVAQHGACGERQDQDREDRDETPHGRGGALGADRGLLGGWQLRDAVE